MPRKAHYKVPTEEEILAQNNVPVEMACRFIGWSSPTLYYALQDQRAPFGMAVKSPKGGWAYNISPGLLVKYKRGDLPTYRLNEVINFAAKGVEQVINAKLSTVQRMISVVDGIS
uniref:Transposase n=1 Tax=Dulem virus 33 TaxID=3145751 RepID=A0AAU8B8P2_9CAUD